MTKGTTYIFSFTASSLRLNEMIVVAKAQLEDRSLDVTNELGNGKAATGKRMLSEFRKRISLLTPDQLQLLAYGEYDNQKKVAFLSVCKCYGFIRDFVVEVLREKLLVYDYQLEEGEYIAFYRRKLELHPEMERLTEGTQIKIRQVTFLILEQAGILDSAKNKVIQPQVLDNTIIKTIVGDNAQWLQIFCLGDLDIAQLSNNQ